LLRAAIISNQGGIQGIRLIVAHLAVGIGFFRAGLTTSPDIFGIQRLGHQIPVAGGFQAHLSLLRSTVFSTNDANC